MITAISFTWFNPCGMYMISVVKNTRNNCINYESPPITTHISAKATFSLRSLDKEELWS
jgi:hypothetical protein